MESAQRPVKLSGRNGYFHCWVGPLSSVARASEIVWDTYFFFAVTTKFHEFPVTE